MQYTLITRNGTIMQFYVKGVAELYLLINGGTLVSNEVLVDKAPVSLYN